MSTCSVLGRRQPAGTWPSTAFVVGPAASGAIAGMPAAAPWATLMPPSHGQRRTIPSPSGPMSSGDHAARGPRGHVDPRRPTGAARHTEPLQVRRGADRGGSAAEPEAWPSGHPDTWTPDGWTPDGWTPDAWTLDAWTLDVRSTGWTDVLTAGPDEADRATTGLASVRTSSRPGDHPPGGPTPSGSRRPGRSATQDGSAVTAPAPRP
jgi:hypothetical protein